MVPFGVVVVLVLGGVCAVEHAPEFCSAGRNRRRCPVRLGGEPIQRGEGLPVEAGACRHGVALAHDDVAE